MYNSHTQNINITILIEHLASILATSQSTQTDTTYYNIYNVTKTSQCHLNFFQKFNLRYFKEVSIINNHHNIYNLTTTNKLAFKV